MAKGSGDVSMNLAGKPAWSAASASRSSRRRCDSSLPYTYAARRRKPHSMPSPTNSAMRSLAASIAAP